MWAMIICFLGTYFLFQFVLEWFIYRKIKLIYKFIYQTKANKEKRPTINTSFPRKALMK